MDGKERAARFRMARTSLNQNGSETKARVYEQTGVPASALVAYESPESTRALSIEYVNRLAAHYGVNAAWLLGQSESWSMEQDVRRICELTGLTPDAVMSLRELMSDEGRRKAVNTFLASEEFTRFIFLLQGMKQTNDSDGSPSVVDYSDALRNSNTGDCFTFNEKDYADMRTWRAEREMRQLTEKLIGI